jgi:hypothetical protein
MVRGTTLVMVSEGWGKRTVESSMVLEVVVVVGDDFWGEVFVGEV